MLFVGFPELPLQMLGDWGKGQCLERVEFEEAVISLLGGALSPETLGEIPF